VHAYDAPRRQSYPPVRSARPAQDSQGGFSATPIYDALYAEYVTSYRTLPGDRTGEEDLRFTGFGSLSQGTSSHGYRTYGAGSYGTRQYGGRQQSPWQRVGPLPRQDTGHRATPAALPPGPRRGT
jgi:hypothetical protein